MRRCVLALVPVALAACPSPPAVVDAGVVDAGVVVVDAGAVVVDAGAPAPVDGGSVPTVETIVDAGTMADVPSPPPTPPPLETTAKPDTTHPVTGFIHDRLLVKPKDGALSAADIERMVEKQLSAKVKTVRRTAGTFWLVQLAPTTPPRTIDDQRRVIEQLQAVGAFSVVEGDQLMQLR